VISIGVHNSSLANHATAVNALVEYKNQTYPEREKNLKENPVMVTTTMFVIIDAAGLEIKFLQFTTMSSSYKFSEIKCSCLYSN